MRLTTLDPVVLKRSHRARLALAGLVVATAAAIVVAIPGGSSETERRCGTNDPNTGWGVGVWPTGCWRPYADDSPFNQPLPDQPRLDPRSDQIVARFTEGAGPSDLRAGIADTAGDYQHPTYWSADGDPEFQVTCTEAFGRCEVEGMRVRIPDLARPAAGSDRHLTVVDQDSGWEYDFWKVESKPRGGGVLRVGFGGRTRIDGDGLGSDSTAAHFGNLAGIIRAPELERGRIDHALFVIADCDSGRAVYPATGLGAPCSNRTDAPSEGTRLQLDMSDAEIRALRAPRWKRTILRAMARYGMFVGDTGGSPWDLEFESGSTYTSFRRDDPIEDIARRAGILRQRDGYHFELSKGIDWRSRLRVVDPCVSARTCD
jgi:hypothetical protein